MYTIKFLIANTYANIMTFLQIQRSALVLVISKFTWLNSTKNWRNSNLCKTYSLYSIPKSHYNTIWLNKKSALSCYIRFCSFWLQYTEIFYFNGSYFNGNPLSNKKNMWPRILHLPELQTAHSLTKYESTVGK